MLLLLALLGCHKPGSLHGQAPPAPSGPPEFTAVAADGSARTREHLVGSPTVLWFYPKAATFG